MLEWGQVDLVRGFISLIPRKTARKNGRSVTIPIHPVLMNILLETGDGERKGYVMPESEQQTVQYPLVPVAAA